MGEAVPSPADGDAVRTMYCTYTMPRQSAKPRCLTSPGIIRCRNWRFVPRVRDDCLSR